MRSTVFLIDNDDKRARVTARILRATGGEVERCGLDDLGGLDPGSLVVAYLGPSEAGELQRLSKALSPGQRPIVLCADNLRAEDLKMLSEDLHLPHVIATNQPCTNLDLFVTVRKLLVRDIFGGDKYFHWGSFHEQRALCGSADLPSTLGWAEAFAAQMNVPARQSGLFLAALEELITNALYDAPTDDSGKYLFADRDRSLGVALPNEKSIDCQLLCDGKRIGVSVKDPYGSMDVSRVTLRLIRCLTRGPDAVEQKVGGAGIGLFIVLSNVSHLIVNSYPGVQTEVVALLDLHDSFRDFMSRGKSLNIFVQTDQQTQQEQFCAVSAGELLDEGNARTLTD